jgi:predicted nucleotidyltransferase component of viral defense system
MITSSELHNHAAREGLRFDQIEKDYVITWLLRGLARSKAVRSQSWVFKGGTCLRHCYYRGYRFSEDIDLSCDRDQGGMDAATGVLAAVGSEVQARSGIQIRLKEPRKVPQEMQVEFLVEYSRGGARRHGLPCVQVHLTFDEPVLDTVRSGRITPVYRDIAPFSMPRYSKLEIIAEKMRTLLQQQKKWPRPRDLYDLWYILCIAKERPRATRIRELFRKKCALRSITVDSDALISERCKEWIRRAWSPALDPMMREVPNYEQVWIDWRNIHSRIFSK